MATIRTSIMVTDGMSPAFRSMNNAMNIVLNSFEAIQSASSNAIDTSSIQTARSELARAEVSINNMEREINDASEAQNRLNTQFQNGHGAVDSFVSKVMKIGTAIGGVCAVKKVFDISDAMVQTNARLDLMNDGLQTTAELQNMIYQSAQESKSAYMDTAAVVSKLGILAGHAFSNNQEMIVFAEQMNKQFKIGGASVQEQTAAMYQLTQAMAAGRLQGDEFRSILENAPMLAQSIAEYMGKSVGELREMSSEGLITADIIKNAMFAAADETNAKFQNMPMTIGQVWTSIKNQALVAFKPILSKINEIVNNDNFDVLVRNIIGGIVVIANISTELFEILTSVAGVIADNWSWIEPIIWGIVAAYIAYNSVALITNGILAYQAFQSKVHAATLMMESGASFTATAAQYGLNAALYACPITWIIIAIIALIAVFYATVAAVNHFASTSVSATGIIMGVFATAGAFIWDLFLGTFELILGVINALINPFIDIANFIGNVFTNPISSVIYLFQGMADSVLGVLEKIASAMDFVFNTDMAGTISGWRLGLKDMADAAVAEYAPNENYQKVMDNIDLSVNDLGLNRISYGDAWNAGYGAGENIENKFDLGNILGSASNSFDDFDDFEMGNTLDGISNGIGDTAGNTAKMADSMEISEDELKYMRDLAEQETINRFTTAEIKVELGGVTNNVSQNTDLDGVIDYLGEKVCETMTVAAEGVHE